MADNKKYYYLKLKENFYESEEMIILQNMQDGYMYSDILMKLYLRSLKNNGKLMFRDVIPYTPQALAQVVRHQVGTVEKALKIFQGLGLIEVLDNGAIYMSDIQNFIGKSSTEADRKREYRDKIQGEIKTIGQKSDICPDKSTPEIEIELELEKELDKRNVKEKKFIKPTLEEIKAYCLDRHNPVDYQRFYDFYEAKGWYVGKNKMKDWKACVRTWERSTQQGNNLKNTYNDMQNIDFSKFYNN